MSTTKKVGYAYPTSPLADELGEPNGCYYIKVGHNDANPKAMSDYIITAQTIEEAIGYAENIDLPYYKWSLVPNKYPHCAQYQQNNINW